MEPNKAKWNISPETSVVNTTKPKLEEAMLLMNVKKAAMTGHSGASRK